MIAFSFWGTKRLILAVALWVTAVYSISAFSLEPITADLEPSGSRSVQTFRLSNPSTQPIAIRIRILTRQEDEAGQEVNTLADDLFTVYPSRVLINPNGIQLVRVQWKGDPNPATELAYRLVVEQMPVDFGESKREGGSIRILTRYVGSLYVVPPHARADVRLVEQKLGTDSNGKEGLFLVFHNQGTAHTILSDLTIEVGGGDTKILFQGDDLQGISGENLLSGARKAFFLPLPEELANSDPSAIVVNFWYEAVR
jgi:fimbrial chaperone protein